MASKEDDDIWLQRASTNLIESLKTHLPRFLWRRPGQDGRRQVHRWTHERAMNYMINCIEPFQEEPQLLDAHLKQFLPELVNAYLEFLKVAPTESSKNGLSTLQHGICRVLYFFCKVRGEKIVSAFLNNEPRYLEPILSAFQKSTAIKPSEGQPLGTLSATWEEKYILLLWLSHLMLAPFDLASISSKSSRPELTVSINLPSGTPGIAKQIVPICMEHIDAPSKERDAAALLLVRLCLRPDMRKIGLLNPVMDWALSRSTTETAPKLEIYQFLGTLAFISRLVASANTDEIGAFIPSIYRTCQLIINNDRFASIRASAIVRKFVIKIFRTIIVLCLQWESPLVDATAMLEEVIEYLLGALADTDTPVRYAASKALSVITLRLDSAMAAEVVEAILGSFDEDVFWDRDTSNLSAVDPLKWHGLTLTLGHVLYRRVPPVDQLPEVINTLLLALNFEQRSTTGASIGTNVRDAACFGIWALSRRYRTVELRSVETSGIRSLAKHNQKAGITQMLAIELLVSACLDPAGNIRRGSSAALQELVGRHPDTIVEGISLVQIVDYHAVSLRARAIEDVGFKAANLNESYWEGLLQASLGWRGVRAVDAPSRQSSGSLIGALTVLKPFKESQDVINTILSRLERTPAREIEDRHGILFALTAIVEGNGKLFTLDSKILEITQQRRSLDDMKQITNLWIPFKDKFGLRPSHFTDSTLRPELIVLAFSAFVNALSGVSYYLKAADAFNPSVLPIDQVLEYLRLCMRRSEGSFLHALPEVINSFSALLEEAKQKQLAENWLAELEGSVGVASRPAGIMLALGVLSTKLAPGSLLQIGILEALAARCTPEFRIETRVIALQSLGLHLREVISWREPREAAFEERFLLQRKDIIGNALITGLNDYTITERGDVGSLVRLEALETAAIAWSSLGIRVENDYNIHASVLRLSLEKLDKVRNVASSTLTRSPLVLPYESATDTASYEYFGHVLNLYSIAGDHLWVKDAILEGYISSAGSGSENVVQASRQALADYLDSRRNDARISEFCNRILDIFVAYIGNERVLVPLLEVIAFLLDAGILTDRRNTEFKWRKLLSLVQKAHYKSTVPQKLHLAIHIYRGLATVEATRSDVLAKLCSMLLHPFPQIRVATAESLFVVAEVGLLTEHDWSREVKALKSTAEEVKRRLTAV